MNTFDDMLRRSIFPYETGDLLQQAKSWPDFIPSLIFNEKDQDSIVPRVLDDDLASYLLSQPYAACFKTPARNFIAKIHKAHGNKFSQQHLNKIYKGIALEYISRCVSASRYALHNSYTSSGLSYSQWVASFQAEGKQSPWLDVAIQYPVLIRLIKNISRNFSDALHEMLNRFENDQHELASYFQQDNDSLITYLKSNLSDPHHYGRMVMRIRLTDGTALIYKPKSLAIEKSFNDFMLDNPGVFGILGIKIMERDGYGWVQDIGDPLEKNDGILLNPLAIGKASATFWLLNATDLHVENVRTTDNGVYAIDLETLLAAPVPSLQNDLGPRWRQHSINATSLFDGKIGEQQEKLRVGGFDPNPVITMPIPYVDFKLIDDKVLLVTPDIDPNAEAQPALAPSIVTTQQMQELKEGFLSAVDIKATQKLLKFVTNLNDDCQLRLVPRNTVFYEHVLQRIYQPRFLRDAAIMHNDLQTMHRAVREDMANEEGFHASIDDEIRQLLDSDIPYFSYTANSLSLNGSTKKVPNFFEATGKEHAIDKIQHFEPSDVSEQITLISLSLGHYGNKQAHNHSHAHPYTRPGKSELDESAKGSLVAEFNKFALNTMQTAYIKSNLPSRWLSLKGGSSATNLQASIGGEEFFSGYWGIIATLQSVEQVTDEGTREKIKEFLERESALWPSLIQQRTDKRYGRKHVALGFSGIGGELFAHSILASQAPDRWSVLTDDLPNLFALAEEGISKDGYLDVIGGTAGLILGCNQILDLLPGIYDDKVQSIQRLAAFYLIEKAVNIDGVPAWKVPGEDNALLGYAHGWSGMVAALSSAERNLEDRDQKKIRDFLATTSSYPEAMLKKHGAWLDMRGKPEEMTPLNDSWCNGIPGFLRGMFEVSSHHSKGIQHEVSAAVDRLKTVTGLSEVHRFCCGEMGSIDLLLDIERLSAAQKQTPSKFLMDATKKILSDNEHHHDSELFPERLFNGLFQGRAGVTYTGLRLLLPKLPSLSGQDLSQMNINYI